MAAGCVVVVAATAPTAARTGDTEEPLRPQGAEHADTTGGPVVRWVPEALPLDGPEAPTAAGRSGGGRLLPNASGVYEARPPFFIQPAR